MPVRRDWTKEEVVRLCDILDDLLAKTAFSTLPPLAEEIQLHFQNASAQGESTFTPAQIENKIGVLARQQKLKKREELLQDWAHYRLKVREECESSARRWRRKEHKLDASNRLNEGSTSNLGDHTSQDEHGQTTSATHSNEVRQSSPLKSPSTPTISPFSNLHSCGLQAGEEQRDLPSRRYSLNLEEWEYKFLLHLREHRGNTGYEPPLQKEHIQIVLQKTIQRIDQSFVHFMLGTRALMPTSSRLTSESLGLSRLLVDLHSDGQTERRLKTLIAGPHMSEQILFRAYTAAVIYEWVLKSFDANLRLIPSSECEQCAILNICEEYNQDVARNVSVKRVNQYLDTVIRPTLPVTASEIQKKLYNVFMSLWVPAAREGAVGAEGFEFQDRKLSQWQEGVEAALLELLDMRTTMAKCQLVYSFRLPAVGHQFNGEWMEPAHAEDNRFSPTDRVYLCLRPAVFAHDKKDRTAPFVLVSTALVMLEGYEVDLTMT